ncbi:MAG TPA: hypothetical protein VFR67_01255 [Pilimelia sp.]|nr:hypothetical protein [Pilimelia sp.]
MTTRNPGDNDHAYWRRPATEAGDAAPGPAAPDAGGPGGTPPGTAQPPGPAQPARTAQPAGAAQPAYTGPPPTEPPPPGYRTPHLIRPAPPRTLPAQDLAGLDEAERAGRTLTLGIGMIAGAVVLILGCLLCSRVLF